MNLFTKVYFSETHHRELSTFASLRDFCTTNKYYFTADSMVFSLGRRNHLITALEVGDHLVTALKALELYNITPLLVSS